jgi:hypothetical protein
MDVICQAKSGMGKTAVFVISVLQQLDVKGTAGEVGALVLCHTRELAYQARPEPPDSRRAAERLLLSAAQCSAGAGLPVFTLDAPSWLSF